MTMNYNRHYTIDNLWLPYSLLAIESEQLSFYFQIRNDLSVYFALTINQLRAFSVKDNMDNGKKDFPTDFTRARVNSWDFLFFRLLAIPC